ncbi:MAG: MipA/OmpV family protein [Hyphomicrobiaceae bacterium]
MLARRRTRLAAIIALAAVIGIGGQKPASATGFSADDLNIPSEWMIGGFLVVTPKYEGSKEYEATGFPFIAPAGADGTGFVNVIGPQNVQIRLLRFSPFEAGPLVGYRWSRDEDDAKRLNGLGDVSGGLIAGGYVSYDFGPFLLRSSYHQKVTGDNTGYTVRFVAEADQRIDENWRLRGRVGTAYASDGYMDAYFSVTPAQSLTSGLPVYDADAGFKGVYASAGFDYRLSEDWVMRFTGYYERLIGDTTDSPIVEAENQFAGTVGLAYVFDWADFSGGERDPRY